ncbi:hypothetical protein K491DRAFT_695597 [Lophiostoma macrostomum CBS 122681]|uniref:Prokaryotic-type class I peptide chain release factors domain-containing protein n=1 Tax=Lophiostoma macrostomum CBS 122681 TaxID=1314788 RepID=A0A6A6SY21_9PLEO|nr:hypothetical protein K491DRAFT_695597 [Lophiostoma macrostomum CBS 122681]
MPPQTTFLLRRCTALPHSYRSTFNYHITRYSSYSHARPPHLHNALPHPLYPSPRTLTTSAPLLKLSKQLPPRRIIQDSEISESFLKGSGPGGQKINKTSSAVQLKHLETGIVVKCQETRSRSQNRKLARQILAQRLEDVELGEGSRSVLKGRDKSRRKKSAEKKRKRKYRALAEGKGGEGGEAEGEGEGEDDGEYAEGEEAVEGLQREGKAVVGDTKVG